jgi:arsenite/tail-anchored protein-transporting ATPase
MSTSSFAEALRGSRFIFVVGKGGVGKTTTAGAIAVGLAGAGSSVRLLSTDPAHSTADLFGADARDRDRVCGVPLALEELDARAAARDFLAEVEPELADLIDAGTWLRADEARTLVRLPLPGVDEVMAALRLVELAGGAERVVVDTAPTGHMLRLLHAGRLFDGWSEALQAMVDKAAMVAAAMTRRDVRPAGAALVDRLREAAARLETDVLDRAAFVIVNREGGVVAAETRRLAEALHAEGRRVAATVFVGGDTAEGDAAGPVLRLVVAWRDRPPSGCAELAAIHAELMEAPAAAPAPVVARAAPARAGRPAAPWLAAQPQRLWLVVGKGGVGKTTCAAALALLLARDRPVVLLGADPAGSLADVLPGGGPAGLEIRQLAADRAFEELRTEYEQQIRRVLAGLGLEGAHADRRVLERLLDLAPPGIDEIVALAALVEDVGTATLVVDTAPTGHLLRLLEMPALAHEWTRALMRVLVDHGVGAATENAAAALLRFARQLRQLRARLADPARAAALIVTLAEPLVARETERLGTALADAGIGVAAVVLNRAAPGAVPPGSGHARRIVAPALDRGPCGRAELAAFMDAWQAAA